jgi:hypothetical protein
MSSANPPAPAPHGIPLNELLAVIKAADESRPVERVGDAIVITHEHFVTTLDVVPPEDVGSAARPLHAVIRVRSVLPADMAAVFKEDTPLALANRMATLGALTSDAPACFVGSRLTIYEGDDQWGLHAGLVLCAAEISANSLFGAVSRTVTGEQGNTSPSAWAAADFEAVRQLLSSWCPCEAGDDGLTAEFPLTDGRLGDGAEPPMALWQLEATSHPDLGGGLFGVLTMPHAIQDEGVLDALAAELNRLEMRPVDGPPHFGAWTRGSIEHTVAYCMFFPNLLHTVNGVAASASTWASARARSANTALSARGFSAE